MTKTRLLVLLVGAVLLGALPAHANHTYTGTATGTGIELLLGGQGLTVGFAETAVQSAAAAGEDGCESGVNACAHATGAVGLQETVTATAPGNPSPQSEPAGTTRDTPLGDGVILELGVVSASAKPAPGAQAMASAQAANIDLTATQTLVEEGVPVEEALQPIIDALDPVAEGAPEGTVDRVQGSLQTILDNLQVAPLVSLDVGPVESSSVDDGTTTTATATAKGAVITVAPTAASVALAPEGLAIVEIGVATATATTNQTTASAEFEPATVRVRVLDPTTGEYDEQTIMPGESGCQTDGTPFEGQLDLCIAVGGGEMTVEGAGAAAVAAGVSISLDIMGMPVVDASLAQARAGVNAAPPAQVTPTTSPSPSPSPSPSTTLPQTGGANQFVVPGLLTMGVATLSGLALRRRLT